MWVHQICNNSRFPKTIIRKLLTILYIYFVYDENTMYNHIDQ